MKSAIGSTGLHIAQAFRPMGLTPNHGSMRQLHDTLRFQPAQTVQRIHAHQAGSNPNVNLRSAFKKWAGNFRKAQLAGHPAVSKLPDLKEALIASHRLASKLPKPCEPTFLVDAELAARVLSPLTTLLGNDLAAHGMIIRSRQAGTGQRVDLAWSQLEELPTGIRNWVAYSFADSEALYFAIGDPDIDDHYRMLRDATEQAETLFLGCGRIQRRQDLATFWLRGDGILPKPPGNYPDAVPVDTSWLHAADDAGLATAMQYLQYMYPYATFTQP